MSSDIWTIVHDGSIIAIAAMEPSDLVVTIDIPYLRHMFDANGTAFLIRLHQCDRFEYRDYSDSQWTNSFADIIRAEPEILSVKADTGQEILITCTEGQLRMHYESCTIALDTGVPVTRDELAAAATHYWQEWERAKQEKR